MAPPTTAGPARYTVVGNPANRRVGLFTAAVRAAGLPPPRVLPWSEVLAHADDPRALFPPRPAAPDGGPALLRIDSPGEDAAVDAALRGVDDLTRVEGTARWYARFTSVVARLARAARAAGLTVLDDPAELAVLFDKRLCHGVLAHHEVPVPPSPTSGPGAPPVRGWSELTALLAGAGLRRAFVKPAHGSSASGVVALQLAGAGRVRAVTSVERTGDGRLYNSLRVRTHTTEREVAALVDALAPDGLHVEAWLPKATDRGRAHDLRVVVVDGVATHLVVRTSRHPMTNLHLGGARGDTAAARAAVEAVGGSWARVHRLAEEAAGCFPGTLCVGVDVLPGSRWTRFAVGEVNAFGDLLPGLTGLPGSGAEGLDTYAAQVAAVTRGVRRRAVA